MGTLTVRLPDSLHEKVRDLAEKEGISMNQLVMLAVSEKITRLDADVQFAHLDALEQFAKAVAKDANKSPDAFMEELLDRVPNTEPQPGDERPALSTKSNRTVYRRDDGTWVNKRANASEASSVHDTQQEVQAAARRMLKNHGRGELHIRTREGDIRSEDVTSPEDDDPNLSTETGN